MEHIQNVEVVLDIEPEDVARLFVDMSAQEQAEFFVYFTSMMTRIEWERQSFYIRDAAIGQKAKNKVIEYMRTFVEAMEYSDE